VHVHKCDTPYGATYVLEKLCHMHEYPEKESKSHVLAGKTSVGDTSSVFLYNVVYCVCMVESSFSYFTKTTSRVHILKK
jgi:hypothetical protein